MPKSLHCFRMLRPFPPFPYKRLHLPHVRPNRLQASSKKSRSMVSSPTFSRSFFIDFSASPSDLSLSPPDAFSMFLIASCFQSDIWLGLTSNSFESSASVFCSFIAANATMALNLFVNFLRFVVIFPYVFALAKLLFFTLTPALNFGVHYSFYYKIIHLMRFCH